MKIALIGTHGTGKTTLAYELTAELKKNGINATMCTETARKCPLPINQNAGFKTQLWIFSAQLKEEIEAEKDYDVVVCDRSVLDIYVYTKCVAPLDADKLLQLVKAHLETYDFLFKTPITDKYLIPDGIRATDREYQRTIDLLMNDFIKEHSIPCFELPETGQIEFIKQKTGVVQQKKVTDWSQDNRAQDI